MQKQSSRHAALAGTMPVWTARPYLLKRSQNSRLCGISKWNDIRSSDAQMNLHSGGVAAAISRGQSLTSS